eukprot:17209-Heterococcus_DN1.PRE.1
MTSTSTVRITANSSQRLCVIDDTSLQYCIAVHNRSIDRALVATSHRHTMHPNYYYDYAVDQEDLVLQNVSILRLSNLLLIYHHLPVVVTQYIFNVCHCGSGVNNLNMYVARAA